MSWLMSMKRGHLIALMVSALFGWLIWPVINWRSRREDQRRRLQDFEDSIYE